MRRNAFGRQVDSFEGDLDVAGLDGPVHAVFIRAPWVEEVGADVEVARHAWPAGEAAGRIVAVRQGPLLATSFHPEVAGDARVHRLFVDLVRGQPTTTRSSTAEEVEDELMSGHSKWATTKHKKAVIDAKRGKMFAKLIKNIEVAARMGGGDPAGNPTLYDAIQKAKKSSVPNDNIDRAVKRGSGAEAGGADYQTIMYEGYGPNGRRAAHRVPHRQQEPRRHGGPHRDDPQRRLAGRPGLGVVPVQPQGRRHRARPSRTARTVTEDDVLEATLDAGAEDVNDLGESFEVVSEATDLVAVRTALQAAGIDYDSAEASFVPDDAGRARRGRAPARCSGSSRRSRTSTTCRTSSPTSTSPTTSWRQLDA